MLTRKISNFLKYPTNFWVAFTILKYLRSYENEILNNFKQTRVDFLQNLAVLNLEEGENLFLLLIVVRKSNKMGILQLISYLWGMLSIFNLAMLTIFIKTLSK